MVNARSTNIIRRAGDTYPSKAFIEVNGVPVNLDDWHVDLVYKKPITGTQDYEEWVINGVITDHKKGIVNFYPHGRLYNDYKAADYVPLTPSNFIMTGEAGANQVWDTNEASGAYPFYILRWRKFEDNYIEEMTHNVGVVYLSDRYQVS